MATDLGEGIIDRFRSLPMSRPAFLLGHLTAEFAAAMLAIAIMVVSGLIVGWRINRDLSKRWPASRLLGLLAVTMLWLGTLIGVHRPLAGRGAGDRLRGRSSRSPSWRRTFVPLDGLPAGLRQFAEYNPVSCWAAAVRTLFGNPTATPADAGWPLAAPGSRLGALVPRDPRGRRPLTLHAYRGAPPAEHAQRARCTRTPYYNWI